MCGICRSPGARDAVTFSAVLKARKGQTVGAVLRKVGRPKAGEGNDASCTISKSSLSPAYLAARLRRDHPEAVFDEAKAGEGNPNNIGISYSRTDPAYLAARLRRDHPEAVFDESVRGSVTY